jgi:hypothetical protein
MMYARIKPYNGKHHKLQTYTYLGVKYSEERGWHIVEDDVGDYLSQVKQIQEGPDAELSAEAFDVVDSEEEAQKITDREKRAVLRADPANANLAKPIRVQKIPGRVAAAGPSGPKIAQFDDLPSTFDDEDMSPAAKSAPTAGVDEDFLDDEIETPPEATSPTKAKPTGKKK